MGSKLATIPGGEKQLCHFCPVLHAGLLSASLFTKSSLKVKVKLINDSMAYFISYLANNYLSDTYVGGQNYSKLKTNGKYVTYVHFHFLKGVISCHIAYQVAYSENDAKYRMSFTSLLMSFKPQGFFFHLFFKIATHGFLLKFAIPGMSAFQLT